MRLYIKNMVCGRCVMVVKTELEKLGLQPLAVDLGVVDFKEPLSLTQKQSFNSSLKSLGFELIENTKNITVEKIKNLIVDLVQNKECRLTNNLSTYITETISQDYNTMSGLFSEIENNTIEHYYIQQKIERVKELLSYNELNLNEIADKLNYSSTGHLSNQFKKITGMTPTAFKNSKINHRLQLDKL